MNQGSFGFAKLHVDRMLENQDFEEQEMHYIGRPSQHSYCSGAASDHKIQGEKLWSEFKEHMV